MKAKPPDHQAIPIDDVHIDPANVRQHPEVNRATIRASLARFGPGRSIVLDANNVVRAGNGTLEEARRAGFDEVLIVEPQANQIVAVKRAWSSTEAAAYAIADNRAAEHADWDDTALASTLRALQSEDFDLAAVGYTADEVDQLLETLAGDTARQALDALANGQSDDDDRGRRTQVEGLGTARDPGDDGRQGSGRFRRGQPWPADGVYDSPQPGSRHARGFTHGSYRS
jgi:hypothetical protein